MLTSCCRRGPDDAPGTCSCGDCRLADLASCRLIKEDGTTQCGGNCRVLQTSCLGFLPQQCSGSTEQMDGDHEADDGVASDGQAQVFMFYEKLNSKEQKKLEDDFNGIEEIFFKEDFFATCKEEAAQDADAVYEVPTVMDWDRKLTPKLGPGANVSYQEKVPVHKAQMWRSMGLDMYGKGYVAVVIMCGGMDARLGQGLPKGILDFGLLSGKSILQLYAERLRRLQTLVSRRLEDEPSVNIPLYIMCNEDNYDLLLTYFEENDYFGLREADVTLFKQKHAPLMDHLGRFCLAEKHKLLMEPCGNGYLFQALGLDGFMQDMKSRSATHLFVTSVDNVLAKIGDPLFIGFCKHSGAEAGLKCTRKRSPMEALGVLATRKDEYIEDIDGDGTVDITTKLKAVNIEFFQMPEYVKNKRLHAGQADLAFDSGNLSQYCFKLDFMGRVHKSMAKKWHLVPKAKPRLNFVTGEIMNPPPGVKNLYRPEMFIFDSFGFTKSVVAFQVPREEYAVIKNVMGLDSPQTALAAIGKLHQQWIIASGGEFAGNKIATDRDDAKCEISPLVSYDGEDLAGQFWMPIELPFYLPSQNETASTSAVELDIQAHESLHYLDNDSELAKQAVEAELKFQIEAMTANDKIEQAEGDEDGCVYDEAATDEELPSTPEQGMLSPRELEERARDQREHERKVREAKEARERAESEKHHHHHHRHALHVDHDTIEVSDATEHLLSTRSDSSHHALSARSNSARKAGPGSPAGSARASLLRGARARAMPGSARSVATSSRVNDAGRGNKSYTARATLLGEHWDGKAASLRCLPQHHHGLERSEYGRRKPVTDYGLNPYWQAYTGSAKRGSQQGSQPGVVVNATPHSGRAIQGSPECAIS